MGRIGEVFKGFYPYIRSIARFPGTGGVEIFLLSCSFLNTEFRTDKF